MIGTLERSGGCLSRNAAEEGSRYATDSSKSPIAPLTRGLAAIHLAVHVLEAICHELDVVVIQSRLLSRSGEIDPFVLGYPLQGSVDQASFGRQVAAAVGVQAVQEGCLVGRQQEGALHQHPQLEGGHGLTIHQDQLYFMTTREVFRAPLCPDGGIGAVETLIDDLPDGGQHLNRTLAVGPDQILYISSGSTCNACDESSQENATLLRASLDGRKREI